MRRNTGLRKIYPYIILFVAGILITIPIVVRTASDSKTDFYKHYHFAQQMADNVHLAHVLYYASIIAVEYGMPNATIAAVNFVSMAIFMAPLPALVFFLLMRSGFGFLGQRWLTALSLSLFIIAPVFVFADGVHILGYVSPTVWHSPTFHALRIFILPVSLLAFRALAAAPYRNLNQRVFVLILAATLVSLSVLAKPSYALPLLPGVCLVAFYRALSRQSVDWLLLALGILLPALVILALQYLINFDNGDGIRIGWLELWRSKFPIWEIPIRLAASLAFPIMAYLCYLSEARKSVYLNMSWLIVFVAFVFMFFFNVTGWRTRHFVFNWGSYAAVFALMYATTEFLLGLLADERRKRLGDKSPAGPFLSIRFRAVASVFALQVVFGIIYYFRFLFYLA